jgi:hypothetical protein
MSKLPTQKDVEEFDRSLRRILKDAAKLRDEALAAGRKGEAAGFEREIRKLDKLFVTYGIPRIEPQV